jgi:hypothetical protein
METLRVHMDDAQAVGPGGVTGQVVGYEIDFLRKCMHVLGWVQNCGRVAAD